MNKKVISIILVVAAVVIIGTILIFKPSEDKAVAYDTSDAATPAPVVTDDLDVTETPDTTTTPDIPQTNLDENQPDVQAYDVNQAEQIETPSLLYGTWVAQGDIKATLTFTEDKYVIDYPGTEDTDPEVLEYTYKIESVLGNSFGTYKIKISCEGPQVYSEYQYVTIDDRDTVYAIRRDASGFPYGPIYEKPKESTDE